MLIGILVIPILIRLLGTDRYGLLTLGWIVIGYFSLFDFGLGRALTRAVAERLARDESFAPLVWSGLLAMAVLGGLAAVVLLLVLPWLITQVLIIPENLIGEALGGFTLLAAAVPFVVLTAGLRGVLEGQQAFAASTLLRVPMGVLMFLAPLAASLRQPSFRQACLALLLVRVVFSVLYLMLCFRRAPSLSAITGARFHHLRDLMRFGSWMTVSNVLSPLMSYLDRFLVGAVLSVAAVAHYATPYDAVMMLGILPGALVGVLFPAFAATFQSQPERTALLFERALGYIWLAMFPLAAVIVLFAPELLNVWLGAEFRLHSTRPVQWLAAGLLINSLAYVPLAMLQAVGRPDLSAKLHAAELVPYLFIVYGLAKFRGIEGVAIAWVVRASLDSVLLFVLAVKRLPRLERLVVRHLTILSILVLALFPAAQLSYPPLKLVYGGLLLSGFSLLAWKMVLLQPERNWISSQLLRR